MGNTRRRVLATGGALLTAGCAGLSLSAGDPGLDIGSIVYTNNLDEQRTVHLRLRREDDDADNGFEVVYDERVTLGAKALDVVPADWTANPSAYTLLYATDGALELLRVPRDVRQHVDTGGCNHVRAEFNAPEGLTVWVTDDPPVDAELPSC